MHRRMKQVLGRDHLCFSRGRGRGAVRLEAVWRFTANEILQIGREVVLLTATQTKFTNFRLKPSKPSFAHNQLGGSFAAIKRGAGSPAIETRQISYARVDSEQFS